MSAVRTTWACAIGSPVTELRTSPEMLAGFSGGGCGAGGCANAAARNSQQALLLRLRTGVLLGNCADIFAHTVAWLQLDLFSALVDLFETFLVCQPHHRKHVDGRYAVLARRNATERIRAVRFQIAGNVPLAGRAVHQNYRGQIGHQTVARRIEYATGDARARAAHGDLHLRAAGNFDFAIGRSGAAGLDGLHVRVFGQAIHAHAVRAWTDAFDAKCAVAVQVAAGHPAGVVPVAVGRLQEIGR